jgi:hypothetical protein
MKTMIVALGLLGARLRQVASFFASVLSQRSPRLPLIFIVVEGRNDIEFLRRMATMLHAVDPCLPDLAAMEQRRELVFMPCGGGDSRSWACRLAGLNTAEFHLLDRDISPATEARRQTAEIVNARPRCRAVLTRLRALENYLHPEAVFEVSGLRVEFSGDDDVADLVARKAHERNDGHLPWEAIPARARKRRRDKTKAAWLNTRAVERMTPGRLAERDPVGEVRGWLETIARLAHGAE